MERQAGVLIEKRVVSLPRKLERGIPRARRIAITRSKVSLLVLSTMFWPIQTAGAQELRNFHHTAWSSNSAMGAVFDIQQSPDGYLWLTTSRGVFRFDGARFQSANEITSGATKNFELASAFVSSTGDVWFRTRLPGLLLWRDGKLSAYPIKGCTPGLLTESMVEDRDHTIWTAGSAGLFIVGEGKCERVGEKYGLPSGFPYAIEADKGGTLWVKMDSGALLYLPRGATRFKPSFYGNGPSGNYAYLHQGPNGSVWVSDDLGLRRVSENGVPPESTSTPDPAHLKGPRFGNFTFDSHGTLWAASSSGVKRIPDASAVPIGVSIDPAIGQDFTVAQGLSSDVVPKLLVDREGSIWAGTNSGLDQLRQNVISQLNLPTADEHQFAVAVGDDGCVWTGNRGLPLTRVCPDGRTRTFAETRQTITIRRGLKGDIWSSGLGANNLWRSSGDGIEPIHFPNDHVEVCASMAVDKNNNLWLLTFGQHVYRRIGDNWEIENTALGREPGILGAMEGDQAGNVWFAFSNHVIEWDGASFHRYTYTGKNRYPVSLTIKGTHVWLGAEDGVQLFNNGTFQMLRWKDPTLPGRVTGMVETAAGDLWTSGFSGIAHVKADELASWLRDPDYAVSGERFDTLDGLPGLAAERYPVPSMIEAGNGRLWLATIKGIAWLDPASHEQSKNSSPPTVLVTSLVWNGETHSDLRGLVVPPRTGRVEIDYTALSLAIPERVLFRYKLEGTDHDWQDAGTRRETSYTGLGPGNYRFHVIACNNDGVWNTEGAVLDFRIAPAWFQTGWFEALCVGLFFLSLWALYQLRLKQLERQFHTTLQTRVDERTRIARELHDTMLQSFQGLLLRFQTVSNLLPARPEEAKARIDTVVEEGSSAITEGRDAVHELRSAGLMDGDLAESIRNFARELIGNLSTENLPEFHIQMEGTPKALNPVVRDEAYRIAAEALRNAIRYAGATEIEVEIRYAQESLALRVRDDGKGIDTSVLDKEHAPGHWGLRGMRERAKLIGAGFEIWSKLGSGTEIELKIPAASAYAKPSASRWPFFSRTPHS